MEENKCFFWTAFISPHAFRLFPHVVHFGVFGKSGKPSAPSKTLPVWAGERGRGFLIASVHIRDTQMTIVSSANFIMGNNNNNMGQLFRCILEYIPHVNIWSSSAKCVKVGKSFHLLFFGIFYLTSHPHPHAVLKGWQFESLCRSVKVSLFPEKSGCWVSHHMFVVVLLQDIEEFSFITQLAGLTDHLSVAARLAVSTGEEES